MMKTIYLGADHAGFALKEKVKQWLDKNRISYDDCGNTFLDKNDDYPDFAGAVGKKVVKSHSFGILFCGSAEGMCIAANKIKGVRAVNPPDMLKAKLSREHNDANILCLGGGKTRQPQPGTSFSLATKMIWIFLTTPFSGEVRHIRRLDKIRKLESLKK